MRDATAGVEGAGTSLGVAERLRGRVEARPRRKKLIGTELVRQLVGVCGGVSLVALSSFSEEDVA